MWLDKLVSLFSKAQTPNHSATPPSQPTTFNSPTPEASHNIEIVNTIDSILTSPLANGLFSGEVILLNWLVGKQISANFPVYFYYQYGLTDTQKSAQSLVARGFLCPAAPENTLTYLKVVGLKAILKQHHLTISGKKATLIQRIQTNLNTTDYSSELPDGILQLSTEGQAVIDEYSDLIKAHQHSDDIINVANVLKTPLVTLQKESEYRNSTAGLTAKYLDDIQATETYENTATLDKHTCDRCGKLDHLLIRSSQAKPGVNLPPFHDGCRCYPAPYTHDLPDVSESWYRDPVTNKSEYGPYTTYQDWKAAMISKHGADVFK